MLTILTALILSVCVLFCAGCSGVSAPPSRMLLAEHEMESAASLCPPGAEPSGAIVFVHGVLGNVNTTWGSWPQIVSRDLPTYGVFVFSYRTTLIEYSSNITEVARQLEEELTLRGAFRCQHIHFVAHSMGGLIVRRLATTLAASGDEEKLEKLRTIFFLSTPTSGSRVGRLISFFSFNPQFGNVAPADLNTYLQTLDHDWEQVLRIRKRGVDSLLPFPIVYCAYETLPTSGLGIVSRSSAHTVCDETPLAIDANHIDIVKPGSADLVSRWVIHRIRTAADMRALTNPRMVLMDSDYPENVYRCDTWLEGATNADDIIPILRSAHSELIVTKELVYPKWDDTLRLLKIHPALLAIHLSAFGRDDPSWRVSPSAEKFGCHSTQSASSGGDKDKKSNNGDVKAKSDSREDSACQLGAFTKPRYQRFKSFIEDVFKIDAAVKVLVYTRASSCEASNENYNAFMREYRNYRDQFTSDARRLVWFELANRDDRSFQDVVTRRNFVGCVDFVLELAKHPPQNCTWMRRIQGR
jgi:pimeloyl-ACP methyl ester carboxylesterase